MSLRIEGGRRLPEYSRGVKAARGLVVAGLFVSSCRAEIQSTSTPDVFTDEPRATETLSPTPTLTPEPSPTQTLDSKESPIQPPSDAKGGVSYNSITPGISTEEVVTEQLGEPLSIDWKGSRKTLDYKSTSPARRHQVVVEEGQVQFIKEIVSINDDTKAQDLIQKYGNPTSVLYNRSYPEDTFSLYVYEEKGLAYLGHEDGTLLEVWYFPPTTIEEFISDWAQGYSLEKPAPERFPNY